MASSSKNVLVTCVYLGNPLGSRHLGQLGCVVEQVLTQKGPKAPEWSEVEASEGSQLKPEEAERYDDVLFRM